MWGDWGVENWKSGWPHFYYSGNRDWVYEKISLSDFMNKQILLRFTSVTNLTRPGDGIYIDDIRIDDYLSYQVVANKNSLVLTKHGLQRITVEQGLLNYTLTLNTPYPLRLRIEYWFKPGWDDVLRINKIVPQKETNWSLYNRLYFAI